LTPSNGECENCDCSDVVNVTVIFTIIIINIIIIIIIIIIISSINNILVVIVVVTTIINVLIRSGLAMLGPGAVLGYDLEGPPGLVESVHVFKVLCR
jgi:hypothetical protein